MGIEIEGKVALVTGSSRGIGRAIVLALLERGAAKVYATARNPEAVADLVAANPGRVVPLALDVTDPAQVARAAAEAGDVEILINNAGYAQQTDLFADDIEAARREFEVNYFGPLATIRALAPVLKDNGGGVIVNVLSVGGLVNFPVFPTYSDSKAAAHSLTTGARILLGGQGTQVVGVYPGPVDTDMARSLEWDKATPASVADAILAGVEAGKVDIFPDLMAEGFAGPFEAGAKTLERRVIEMVQ